MTIILSEEQRAKLEFIGLHKCRFISSTYEDGKMFVGLDKVVSGELKSKHLKLRGKQINWPASSPFACFPSVESAIIAMLDTSGKYYWE